MDAKYQTIGKATDWLQDRLNELRAQARLPSMPLLNTRRRITLLTPAAHLINEPQLSELNTALVKAHADTVEAKARLDQVSQIISSEDLDPSAVQKQPSRTR